MNDDLYRPLPDGLTELAPGPALGAALALVDRASCNALQLAEVLRARNRQICWEQAQLLADVHELAHAPHPSAEEAPRRRRGRGAYLAEEVSLALSVTKRAAGQDLAFASHLFNGFEPVHAALAAGRIDLPKAKMLLREVRLLDRGKAASVIDAALSTVDQCSYVEIRDSVRRLVSAIDPRLVRGRERTGSRRRCVRHTNHADGTASIVGLFLPAEAVAAALDHLDELTTATKRAASTPGAAGQGESDLDERSTNQIRADIFLDLLRGPESNPDARSGDSVGTDGGRRRKHRSADPGADHPALSQASPRPAGRIRGGRRRHRSADQGRNGTSRRAASSGQTDSDLRR
jgi:Domain of unknown function (DUF222)